MCIRDRYGSLLETNDVRLVKRSPLTVEFSPRGNNDAGKGALDDKIDHRDNSMYGDFLENRFGHGMDERNRYSLSTEMVSSKNAVTLSAFVHRPTAPGP